MSETVSLRNLESGLGTRSHCGIHKLCQTSLAEQWSKVCHVAGLGTIVSRSMVLAPWELV